MLGVYLPNFVHHLVNLLLGVIFVLGWRRIRSCCSLWLLGEFLAFRLGGSSAFGVLHSASGVGSSELRIGIGLSDLTGGLR
jgi:hypothetical protein